MSSCTIRASARTCTPFPYKHEPLQHQAAPESFNKLSSALGDLKQSLKTAHPDDITSMDVMRQSLQALLVGYADHNCDPHFEAAWDRGDVSASVDDMIKAVNDPESPLRKALTETEVNEVLCAIKDYQSLIHTPAVRQDSLGALVNLGFLAAENFKFAD
jgi:hypothetical protein